VNVVNVVLHDNEVIERAKSERARHYTASTLYHRQQAVHTSGVRAYLVVRRVCWQARGSRTDGAQQGWGQVGGHEGGWRGQVRHMARVKWGQ